ncbi:MAG: Gfo/Idh/MocA family oxidoreductase [Aquificaceae bacterium]|nr:Gfo/Idh/MocA family oxidoreductase [Aquificaceae bacterium]
MKMHVLLIGLGNMGNKYFWKLEHMGEKLVLCDIDQTKSKDNYPFYCHFGDIKEELKAVIVAVDPKNHTEIAREFLQRGVPVLLEKPPALSSEEFKTIVDYDGLYVSEVESYSVCVEFIRKPKRYLKIERFGKGKGYISPLWDLAWHDLYLLQKVTCNIRIESLEVNGGVWRVVGFADDIPFELSVAWEHPQPRRVWQIDEELLLDFGEERVYENHRLIKEEKRDKLKLMIEKFLSGSFDRGSVLRAYENLKILQNIT